MRTKFDNKQLAHVWAQMSQPEGSSDSMRFIGPVLYSHGTPIAKIHEVVHVPSVNENGRYKVKQRVALLSSQSFSITTSGKHMPAARSAVSHLPVFRVPFVGADGGRAEAGGKQFHRKNIAHYMAEYRDAVKRLKTPRKSDGLETNTLETLVGHLSGRLMPLSSYCVAFGLKGPKAVNDGETVVADAMMLRAARAKYYTPAAVEKRKKAYAAKDKEDSEKKKKIAKEQLARYEQAVAAWRMGDISQLPWGVDANYQEVGALLRVSGDGKEVQTSRGAAISMKVARRALLRLASFYQQAAGKDGPVVTLFMDVPPFKIDKHDGRGITAGCHFIRWEELKDMAYALEVAGWAGA